MKIAKLDLDRFVAIGRHHWDVPVRVRLQPYVLFNRHIDGELQKLVARWEHLATPMSLRQALRR
jgi:hypothetical protein